ncbi:expressed unknown protein [Seminavis robusta]|uniref:HTH CENPB-type domain-containing protein n=1 Tax=Seminavis robusta TaxID=568900 RepID=A0A9N8DS89_9STRA|nr:expressed unknown protein [Seminavis robusta]|eukprot:Sro333_g119630.1 n/a (407) ;mRNA; f:58579-59799
MDPERHDNINAAGTGVAAATAAAKSPPTSKRKASHSKPGPKLGSKRETNRTVADWYNACHTYTTKFPKMAKLAFLRSDSSGPLFSGSKSEHSNFIRKLQQYEIGKLNPQGNVKRRQFGKDGNVVAYKPPPAAKGPASYCKPGPKKGSKRNTSITVTDWYNACHTYRTKFPKMAKSSYLKSSSSGTIFSGSKSEAANFGRKLKEYDNGTLTPQADTRRRTNRKFAEVEKMLIGYLTSSYTNGAGKCGSISYKHLRQKALEFSKELGIPEGEFGASNGWLSGTLKRHQRDEMNRHEEPVNDQEGKESCEENEAECESEDDWGSENAADVDDNDADDTETVEDTGVEAEDDDEWEDEDTTRSQISAHSDAVKTLIDNHNKLGLPGAALVHLMRYHESLCENSPTRPNER